jgi:hypothetical protein
METALEEFGKCDVDLNTVTQSYFVVEAMFEEENCRRKSATQRTQNFRRQCELSKGMEY